MPRRIAKIGFGIPAGQSVTIDKARRTRIEKAYGRKLTPDVWLQIEARTSLLTIVRPVEKNATSITAVSNRLNAFIKAAYSLRQALEPSKPRIPLVEGSTLQSIYRTYFEINVADLTCLDTYPFLLDVVEGTIALSTFVRDEIKEDYMQGFDEGMMWDVWIQGLTETLNSHDLPTGARKDSSGPTSAFVRFVRELQKELPAECRKLDNDQTIATAIYRARR